MQVAMVAQAGMVGTMRRRLPTVATVRHTGVRQPMAPPPTLRPALPIPRPAAMVVHRTQPQVLALAVADTLRVATGARHPRRRAMVLTSRPGMARVAMGVCRHLPPLAAAAMAAASLTAMVALRQCSSLRNNSSSSRHQQAQARCLLAATVTRSKAAVATRATMAAYHLIQMPLAATVAMGVLLQTRASMGHLRQMPAGMVRLARVLGSQRQEGGHRLVRQGTAAARQRSMVRVARRGVVLMDLHLGRCVNLWEHATAAAAGRICRCAVHVNRLPLQLTCRCHTTFCLKVVC